MNEELKLRHLATITHESAVEMYEKLCAACEQREGGMTDPDQMLVADIARAEQIKQQLFPRMPHHEAIGKAQIRKALPNIPRHFPNHRGFCMYHLIMRKHQHKMFTVRIH